MRIRTHTKRFKGFGRENPGGATCLTAMWVLYKASPEVCLKGSGKGHEAIEVEAMTETWLPKLTCTATQKDYSACI